MRTKIDTKHGLATLFFLLCSCTVLADPNYSWNDKDNSDARSIAVDFLASEHEINEFTRIAIKADVRIEGDRVVETIKSVWFYPDQTDIDSDGNEYVYWDQQVETLTIREAGIVGPTGRYQRVNPDNVRVVDDDTYNIFTDIKKVILPYSGLSAGDVSVLEYEIRYPLTQLESHWSFSLHPNTNHPTLKFELSARSDSIQLNWSQIGSSVQCKGSTSSVFCSGENVPAYEADSGVLWRDIIDYIHISSHSDWSSVINESLEAFNKAELESPEVDRLFSRLVSSSKTIAEKITRIHNYVARDIRYLSLSELGHRVTPHTVAFVDENRFGDCKDKTAATVALLRKLGLVAYPVLVATTRRDPQALQTPSAGFFNHMIACFEFEGNRYCIDATDTDTHWGSIASWIQGRVILPLKQEAQPIRLIDDQPRWKFSSQTEIVFGKKAEQFEKQSRTYYSSYAGDVRASLRAKSEDERVEKMVDEYQTNVSDEVSPEFKFERIDDLSADLQIRSSVEYSDFLEPDEDLNYTEQDHWLRYELANSKLSTEHNDTEFAGMEIETKYEFDMSALWTITRLPARLNLKGRFGELSRKVSLHDDGKLSVVTKTNVPRQAVSKDRIKAFNAYLDLLKTQSSINMQGKLSSE